MKTLVKSVLTAALVALVMGYSASVSKLTVSDAPVAGAHLELSDDDAIVDVLAGEPTKTPRAIQ